MDRISRALELARAQRDGRAELRHELRTSPRLESLRADSLTQARIEPRIGANTGNRDEAEGVSRSEPVEAAKPCGVSSICVSLSPTQRERERILPPGSTGPMGGAYKMLRTQVTKRLDQLHANSLAIFSATSGAGKTLTAINLAIAIAADAGRNVLLVDFDLRNPNIHRRLGHDPKVGIEECLASGRPIHEAMFKLDGYERLTILPARVPTENSSELLRSQRTIDAIAEMRARYADRVLIFDLPPVLQADDALAFSRYVQTGLLVVHEGRSKREDVTRTIELLRELPIVGTVLNGSRQDARVHY